MSDFQLWTKKMESDGFEVCKLEDNGNAKLYQTWIYYESHGYYFRDRIAFHIWCGDKWECFTDYATAYKALRERYDDRQ